MSGVKLASAIIKALVGSGVAVTLTLLFHGLILPTSDLPYVLLSVVIGSFVSAFFADYTGDIVCEDEEEDTSQQYITLSSVFFILGVTNVMDNKIASAGWILASLLLAIAAYWEADKGIEEMLRTD